jgi:hypothetical protein
MTPLPYEILQAMIQCFGKAFHYKDNLSAFFHSCGVSRELNDMHREQAKFVWGRSVLRELGQTESGCQVQRRILTELCKLRDIPDKDAPDRDAGLKALLALKQLALEQKLYVEESREKEKGRSLQNEERQKIIQERKRTLDRLSNAFRNAIISDNRQEAGYSLEDLLKELFAIFEIEYRKSYRIDTQQIDGHFRFEGFDYLVEAKWRKDMPTETEIGGFKQKVDTKIESTRGLFMSVQGYRPEVITQFSGRGANIILMDGSHLIQILEGRHDLRDVLRAIISKAAQEGVAYTPVSSL